MKYSGAIFFILFILSISAKAQFFRNIHCKVDAGAGFSIGPEKEAEIHTQGGRVNVSYAYYRNYRYPTLRIKGFVFKKISKRLNTGIRVGVNVHYLEINAFGKYETNMSVPIEGLTEVQALKINKKKSLFFGGAIGCNVQNLDYRFLKIKSGFLGSAELSACNPDPKQNNFYYKAGFEYSEDNCSFYYRATNIYVKDELIKYKQRRRQLFVAIGFAF